MTLERFLPEQPQPKKSLLHRIFKGGLVTPEARKPFHREVYNADRSKRFLFFEWLGDNNFQQLHVALHYAVSSAWVNKIQVMARWENGKANYGVELSVIAKQYGPEETYFYDKETGGKKRFAGAGGGPAWGLTNAEHKALLEKIGIIHEKDLPDYIDYERTAIEFLNQAKRLDFETEPKLYSKELIKSQSPVVIPSSL
ncbi:MAG TPA: hypothetical protein VJ242_04765 [Patescibacteria group bacterium]|nr:hypothetical protein [Patescibacteria group bacterium]